MKELETKRLRLRYINENDVETAFNAWTSDPEVTKYLTWNAHASIDETKYIFDIWIKEYEDPDTYRWGIERKEDNALMGMIDVVRVEDGAPVIGYCTAKMYWGNGYMTEALGAVVEELFDNGIDTIKISAVDENIGSNRVIEKCGFRFVNKTIEALSEMKPDTIVTINNYRIDR